MGLLKRAGKRCEGACMRTWGRATAHVREAAASDAGQGTTEYAILVGVLVVIAILAIMVFRPSLQALWDAIAEGITGL